MTHRISILLVALSLFSIYANALRDESHTITFSEADYSFREDSVGNIAIDMVDALKLISYPEGHEPGLPVSSIAIAVQGGSICKGVTPVFSKRLLLSNVRIAESPEQMILGDNEMGQSENRLNYDMNTTYPGFNCRLVSSSQWHGVSVVNVDFCPFIYNAAEGNLYFIDSVDINLTLDDSPELEMHQSFTKDVNFLKSLVVNPYDVDSIMASQPIALSQEVDDPVDYVIITTTALKYSFEKLRLWKQTKGLYSKIVTIEEIKSKYTGNDLQLKIKNCLYDLYKNHNLKYALLGGDDTVVPVRGCICTYLSNKKDEPIPTDLYYACFGNPFNWDGNRNGLYGECADSIDLNQNICVTRVPVRSAADVTAFTAKLLNYEQNPKWSNRILMCGNHLYTKDENYYDDAEIKAEKLYVKAIKPYWNGERVRFFNSYTDIDEGGDYRFSPANLQTQLMGGYDFVSVITHGGQTKFTMEDDQYYSTRHASRLKKISPTIITTIACNTNAFDTCEKYPDDPCLSESFIRNPNSGVVAYLGCSRNGIGEKTKSSLGPSFEYEMWFYVNLFSDKYLIEKNYGAVVAAAKSVMMPRGLLSETSVRWIQLGLNPIGDPEMPVFISQPMSFENAKIQLNTNGITVNTGEPDCRVCIMSLDDNGKSYYKVFKECKYVSINDVPSKCRICITKQGFIPKLLKVHVLQNETLIESNAFDCDCVIIGSNVTSSIPKGSVMVSNGETIINASDIIIGDKTAVERNATLILNNN